MTTFGRLSSLLLDGYWLSIWFYAEKHHAACDQQTA
jgi:hypothetical protein